MIGQTISHYNILEKLGGGGMGVVFKAEDTRLHRTVALKFLHPELFEDESERHRFAREAEAAAQLGHTNIATVYDYEEVIDPTTSARQAFIAMEFVEGKSLREIIAQSQLPFDDVTSIALQLAHALEAAHQKGIVHRDVKPANIILREDRSIKLLDFGIAKRSGETRVTAAGHIVGSMAYMSPEQLSAGVVDQRSDIWSFGVVLYELLTRHLPFRGEHAASMAYSITEEDPLPIDSFRHGIPEALSSLCGACLRKDPRERPESMAPVIALLEGNAPPLTSRTRYARYGTRHWRVTAGVLASIALFIGVYVAIPGFSRWILGEPPMARKILVILPFVPIDSSGDMRSACAGLSWMVPSRLAQLMHEDSSVSLVGSADVSKYGISSAEEARRVLGASLVVRGGLQQMGALVRMTVDLFDPATNRHLDSRNGTYASDGYVTMENDALRQIADMLGIAVRAEKDSTRLRGTADDLAYLLYSQGRGYLLQSRSVNQAKIATDLFLRAIGRDGRFAQAHAGLGEAYWRLYVETRDTSYVRMAESETAEAMVINGALVESQIAMGIVNQGRGRYEDAIENFRAATAFDPMNTSALRGLADAQNSLGQFEEAETNLKRAITNNPAYCMGYSALGYFYYTRGRYADAAKQFRIVTELTPDNVDGFNNLGAMMMFAQDWKEASAAFERGVQMEPSASLYSNLGSVKFYVKDYLGAVNAYEHALSLDSSDYRVWGSLAAAQYWGEGMRNRAMTSYTRAAHLAEVQRAIDPRDAEVLSHLGCFYSFLGQRERALPLIERSLEGSKNAPEIFERCAESLSQMGERTRAVSALRRALETGADPGLIRLNPALDTLRVDPEIAVLLAQRSAHKQ